jgi:integrase
MRRYIPKQLNIAVLILGLTGIASLSALGKVKSKNSESSTFRIVNNRKSVPILYDRDDAGRIAKEISKKHEKPRVLTLSVFKRMIEQYAETNYSNGTTSIYKRSFEKLIHSLGDIMIKSVTPLLIEKFKQECHKKVTAETANIYLRTISAAFNRAKDWKLLDDNPAKSCKLIRVQDKEPIYLSKESIKKMLEQISDAQFRLIILLAIHTGMRRGEIVNLKWEDINFSNHLIRVRNRDTFTVKGGHPRTIPLHPYIYKLLKPLQNKEGYVFLDNNGKVITPYYISRTFKKYIRKCKLPEKYHFHSLRHTCGTLLIQMGVPLFDVQKILGHRSINTTQIYAHLENDNLRKSLERLDIFNEHLTVDKTIIGDDHFDAGFQLFWN